MIRLTGATNSQSAASRNVLIQAVRLYHVPVHPLAERLLTHIRQHELLHAGDRVGVAVSGGIDSVALLHLLLELRGELGIVLSVVHFNHKLRGVESDSDENFVADFARQHNLEFHSDSDDVAGHAREQGVSLETAARELRYGYFRHLIREPQSSGSPSNHSGMARLDKIATGHTLDDQAETVLMRVIRGAGLRGLAGIHPRIPVDDHGELCGEIIRPLLAIRRRELQQYLADIAQPWREDSSNADTRYTRNRVRQLLVPLLEKEFNPAVAENLSELADIARGEEDYWDNEIAGWMGTAVHWSEPAWARTPAPLVQIAVPAREADADSPEPDLQSRIQSALWLVMNASLDRIWFLGEPLAVQRRVIKAIAEQTRVPLEFKHIQQIIHFAAEDTGSGKELSLPLGWKLIREHHDLLFVTPDLRHSAAPHDYEYPLPIPGQVIIGETGSTLETRRIPADAQAGYNPERLLDADSLRGPCKVRNWRAGDRFWPAHTKSPKKIKELLQECHVPRPERKLWPVVVSGNDVVWMRGFPPPAQFRARPGRDVIRIVERSAHEAE